MEKKLGRPKLPKAWTKNALYAARFTAGESKQIEMAITRSGLSKSAWIRSALLNASEDDKDNA
jgi:hypothetical protein